MADTLLELKEISKYFPLGRRLQNRALNKVSLTVKKGETLGLVGESGCGKSTLAKIIMGVYPPSSGQVLYKDREVRLRTRAERKQFAAQVQMVFQDPYTSLDPYMTVESIVGENLDIHERRTKADRLERIYRLLEMTGLSEDHIKRFPHEFSGGQRQRIGIARALAVRPELIICDEPVSALDLSIQSQIINLLTDLKKEFGLTYLFISHDLNIVQYFSDRIAVMYAGKIMEVGKADEIYQHPVHPYTQMLLRAVLTPKPEQKRFLLEEESYKETEGGKEFPSGCPFLNRCPVAEELCRGSMPELEMIETEHLAACHMAKSKTCRISR